MTWAVVALALLALLPGLLVVRAPWTAVPALSLAFWTLSLWWPPLARLPRGRVLAGALAAFALLALLRLLPRHEHPPPPGWRPSVPPAPPLPPAPPPRPTLPPPRLASRPSLAVLVVALALVVPAGRFWHAPGPGMAFQTTAARLLVWRDGVPLTGEPLLPPARFGAHAPAIAGLAADTARLSGVDPARAVLLVFVAAIALTLIGLFALEAGRLRPAAAAVACLWGCPGLAWPDALAAWGSGEASLCLAFLLPASALLLGHASRSSAIAAGMLLAAGLVAQPLLAFMAWAAVCLAYALGRGPGAARAGRPALACAAAALLGAPGLWPALRSASRRELLDVLASPTPREAVSFLVVLGALVLAAAVARRLAAAHSRRGRTGVALCGAVAAALLVALVQVRVGRAQLPAPRRDELARLAATTRPLDVVCAPAEAVDWVPALAGRAVGEPGPWVPPVYREEWARDPRAFCGERPVTSFHVARRNQLLP